MSKARIKEIICTESYFMWDGSLSKLIEQLEAWRQKAPVKQRDDVEVEIEPEGGYEGSCGVNLSVFYMRDETDSEEMARRSYQERACQQQEASERRQYEALRRKFDQTAEKAK